MAQDKEIQVQNKKEVAEGQETTIPARYYIPDTDIFEDDRALTVMMEMPGVTKANLAIDLENDRLKVEGRIDFSNYEQLDPVYTEYNVGHYQRAFSISNKIDRDNINAELTDGVLTLVMPKAEEMKPRKIQVK